MGSDVHTPPAGSGVEPRPRKWVLVHFELKKNKSDDDEFDFFSHWLGSRPLRPTLVTSVRFAPKSPGVIVANHRTTLLQREMNFVVPMLQVLLLIVHMITSACMRRPVTSAADAFTDVLDDESERRSLLGDGHMTRRYSQYGRTLSIPVTPD